MLIPRRKTVKKETVTNESRPNSTSATQTKTVSRKDGTPRKIVVKDFTSTYKKSGFGQVKDIDKVTKIRFDKSGKPKSPMDEYNLSKIRPNGDTPLSISPAPLTPLTNSPARAGRPDPVAPVADPPLPPAPSNPRIPKN
jgi:hypothetical protein